MPNKVWKLGPFGNLASKHEQKTLNCLKSWTLDGENGDVSSQVLFFSSMPEYINYEKQLNDNVSTPISQTAVANDSKTQDRCSCMVHWIEGKKNVLPDYCTDDVPNGFSSQMNNMLSRIVDWIPSGLRLTSRAEMEASTEFLNSGVGEPHCVSKSHWKGCVCVVEVCCHCKQLALRAHGLCGNKQIPGESRLCAHHHLSMGFRVSL